MSPPSGKPSCGGAIWLRARLAVPAGAPRAWLLEVAYPPLDRVELYVPDAQGNHVRTVAGDTLTGADFAKGEYRWVAQVMKEVVYAEPANLEARSLCADALEQMGYQAESATWRNAFLYGAQELRHGVFQVPARSAMGADTLAGLATDVFFDLMAIRLDAAKAAGQAMVINWHFTDRRERLALTLKNCTLTHRMGEEAPDASASVTTTRATMDDIMLRRTTVADVLAGGAMKLEGDMSRLAALLAMMDQPAGMMFDVVTPGEGR